MANQHSPWTRDDLRFLENSAGQLTAVQIADTLGRGHRAVLTKASRLGISLLTAEVESRRVEQLREKLLPFQVGSRKLIAKTCISCGRLLPARRFSSPPSKNGRWSSACKSCRCGSRLGVSHETTKKVLATHKSSVDAHASRSSLPWTPAEISILRDTSKTLFQVAVETKRTYSGVAGKAAHLGIQRVENPDQGKLWVIELNPTSVENAITILENVDSSGIPTESDWEWSD
jgi:hypothetical protein